MKKTSIILFLLLIVFCFTDCKKKRYPKDIPGWLKKKIEAMEKDTKNYNNGGLFYNRKQHICLTDIPLQVDEYFNGSSTYYWIGHANFYGYIVYNADGIKVCETSNGYPPCGNNLEYGNYDTFVRNVWIEDCQ